MSFTQFFDGKHVVYAGELDLADFVLRAGIDGKGDIHQSFLRRLFHNLGLGPCDLSFEVAVFKKDGKKIFLGLKCKPAARVILAGEPAAGSLELRHFRRASAS